jgi:hypothetical protein
MHTQAMISSESYSDVTSDVNSFQKSESVEDRQDCVGEELEFLRKADRKTLSVKQESVEDSCNSLLMDPNTSNRIHQTSSRIAGYQRQASKYIEDHSGEREGSQFFLPVTTRLARQGEDRNCKKPRPLAPCLGRFASFVADSVARRIQRPKKASANANKEKISKFGTHSEELADIMSSVEPASASALRMSDVEHSTKEDQSPRLILPLHWDSEGEWKHKEWKRKMSSVVL